MKQEELQAEELKIQKVVNDPLFTEFVYEELSRIITARRNVKPRPGYALTRDWYDQMREQGQVNPTYFVRNIYDIWLGKSNLSSAHRKAINTVCSQAYNKLRRHYENVVKREELKGGE